MPYRTVPLVNGYSYHIFNRGVEKKTIFTSDGDRIRFLKTIIYYQRLGPKPKFSMFNRSQNKQLKGEKIIEIIAFCLMPNHFHLLIKQNRDKAISEFLSKVTNSYTKYFNTKYNRVGPLFQGQFKAVLVESDEQITHLSRYIHLNPFVSDLINKLEDYSWSSFSDYLDKTSIFTHLGGGITTEEVLRLFKSRDEYKNFVKDHQSYTQDLALIKNQLLE